MELTPQEEKEKQAWERQNIKLRDDILTLEKELNRVKKESLDFELKAHNVTRIWKDEKALRLQYEENQKQLLSQIEKLNALQSN